MQQKKRLVVLTRVVTLVAWLMLVSEANCIKQPERWFLPLFLIPAWGNNKGTTVSLYYTIQPW